MYFNGTFVTCCIGEDLVEMEIKCFLLLFNLEGVIKPGVVTLDTVLNSDSTFRTQVVGRSFRFMY